MIDQMLRIYFTLNSNFLTAILKSQ